MASASGCEMDRSIFRVCMGTVCVLLSIGQAYANEPPWQHVRAMPFRVRDSLEIAQQAAGKAPAYLYLVCSQSFELHLILSTRLPGPRSRIEKGHDDNVSLFVGNVNQQLKVAMDLIDRGQDLPWLEAAVSHDGDGELDMLVTMPIRADEIATIGAWFGDTPPSKVSIVGYSETGVFMAGVAAGPAITEFSASCVGK